MSPLRDMAYRGSYDTVRHLLKHASMEVDVFLASIIGDAETIQQLVAADPTLAQTMTPADHVLGPQLTPLHLAASGGHMELVQWLLDNGAAINATGYKGFTPLHFVISFGPKQLFDPLPDLDESAQGVGVYYLLVDMPRLLIEKGADLTARETEHQLTPLGLATSKFDDETDRKRCHQTT